MTLIQEARPIPPVRPTMTIPSGIGARVRLEGSQAGLDDVLHAIVMSALGPDARVAVDLEEWARLEETIRGPVAVAASVALERLAADLDAALPRRMPEVVRRLGDHRQRAELGYD